MGAHGKNDVIAQSQMGSGYPSVCKLLKIIYCVSNIVIKLDMVSITLALTL